MIINKFKLNFNFITSLLLLILFASSLSYADSNGIWTLTQDIRGGTFGSDEQGVTSNYTFTNPVYFGNSLRSLTNPFTYYLNFDSLTKFNDLSSSTFITNLATVNGNTILNGNLNINNNGNITIDNGNLIVTTTSGNAIFANSTNADGIITTNSNK